jgi:SAM-dependent methyltransferase
MKSNIENTACPLCCSVNVRDFFQDKHRSYYQCNVCGLVFVPSSQFVSAEDEKKRYDLHQNSPENLGYCAFLNRLVVPLQHCLAPKSIGLDFGSGPSPTLSLMFEQAGHSMTLFDYFYKRDPAALEKQYDFITATEVLEHLHDPKKELERLWGCLKQGGHLGIMTQSAVHQDAFSAWHYKNDLTHICFFSRSTFTWLAHQWDAEMTFPDEGVVIFRKK